jgi:molecular chaperone GrpE
MSEQEAELERLRGEVEDARSKADVYLDLVQRTQAELVNYRRRVEAERLEDARRARAGAVEALLPLLDDLDLALAHLPDDLREHAWAKGVALLTGRLQATLGRLGVERVGQVGEPFDPNVHEAIASEPRAGVESGQVAEVVRAGYRAGQRLLRPAQVVVGAEGEPPPPVEPPAPLEATESVGEGRKGGRAPGELLDERA